jgi:mannosyltransferase OCH1-like enzyme
VIPRTIHQIWIGPDPLPDDQGPWIESWKRHHPGWEHRFWTEETLPDDPIRPEVLDRLRHPVERADILRLEILYRHGGVYVDTDLECLRPIDDLIAGESFVGVNLKPGRATNTMIASAPGHPLLEKALASLRPMDVYWTPSSRRSLKESAGPPFLDRLVREYPDVKLLEPPLCFPATAEEREAAVAVHHRARTWHNVTTLRAAMLRAERRLDEARASLEREQRRHAATKKKLARAEQRTGRPQSRRAGIRGRFGRRPSA